jgi:hypothetical protein
MKSSGKTVRGAVAASRICLVRSRRGIDMKVQERISTLQIALDCLKRLNENFSYSPEDPLFKEDVRYSLCLLQTHINKEVKE